MFYRPGWPTRDGVIPYKLFGLLVAEMDALEKQTELQLVRSVALGAALMWNGEKNTSLKRAVRQLADRAFPEIVEDPPVTS